MEVKLSTTDPSVTYHMLDSEFLRSKIDNKDLSRRNSTEIIDKFHIHWFCQNDDKNRQFIPPIININRGKIFFVNGRHRTLLLMKYLEEIPIALWSVDKSYIKPTDSSRMLCNELFKKELKGTEVFIFPDLPIEYLGFDENIGK